MTKTEKYGAKEEILLACLKLENKGFREFTEWQITVEAWELNKNRFGLRGFEEKYPDHKKVHLEVVARDWSKGILERVRENVYKLTPAGKKKAANITGEIDDRRKADIIILDKLNKYLNHVTFRHYKNKEPKKINWNMVASFYVISWRLPPGKIRSRMKEFKKTIAGVKELIKLEGEEVLRRNMNEKSITLDEIITLEKLHDYIQVKFKNEFSSLLDDS